MSIDRITHPGDRQREQVIRALAAEMSPRFASLETAAAYYDVSQRTVRRAIEDGQLPAVRVGRQIRIAWADLEAWGQPVDATTFEAGESR